MKTYLNRPVEKSLPNQTYLNENLNDKDGCRYRILQLEPNQEYSQKRYKDEIDKIKADKTRIENLIIKIDDKLEVLQKARYSRLGGFAF